MQWVPGVSSLGWGCKLDRGPAHTNTSSMSVSTLAQQLAELVAKVSAPLLIKEFETKFADANAILQLNALRVLMSAIATLDATPSQPKPLTPSREKAMSAFCAECLVRELSAEVKLHDLLTRHKDWAKSNRDKMTLTKSMIIQKMTEIYGKPVDTAGKVWGGVRLKEEDEEATP